MFILFWILLGIITYVYFCYPVCVFVLSKLRPFCVAKPAIEPRISIIVGAYNEEASIAEKIENTLALDYPRDKMEIIVVSDGSTDRTEEIARKYENEGVKVIALPTNMGKSEAQNAGMAEASGEIIVFTDADIMAKPDALRLFVRSFADPQVGFVTCQPASASSGSSQSAGERVYWKYERALRQWESDLGCLAMGSGWLIGIRRDLLEPLQANVGDDFALPLLVCRKGFISVVEGASEVWGRLLPSGVKGPLSVKARIVSKDLRGLWLHRAILNPLKYPLYSWGLISHKLLRWLVPFFLIGIFVANCCLLGEPFYKITLTAQSLFYMLAIIGLILEKVGRSSRMTAIPLSFCVVNTAALLGVLRFLSGKKSGRWKPVRGTE